jgi:activator of HSP90 ATPase
MSDRTLNIKQSKELLDFIEQYFKLRWPDNVSVTDGHSVFIYRDRQALESWEIDGGTYTNLMIMVEVIWESHQFTIVGESNIPVELEQNIRANWPRWHWTPLGQS